jgi:hypothetical protein
MGNTTTKTASSSSPTGDTRRISQASTQPERRPPSSSERALVAPQPERPIDTTRLISAELPHAPHVMVEGRGLISERERQAWVDFLQDDLRREGHDTARMTVDDQVRPESQYCAMVLNYLEQDMDLGRLCDGLTETCSDCSTARAFYIVPPSDNLPGLSEALSAESNRARPVKLTRLYRNDGKDIFVLEVTARGERSQVK